MTADMAFVTSAKNHNEQQKLNWLHNLKNKILKYLKPWLEKMKTIKQVCINSLTLPEVQELIFDK